MKIRIRLVSAAAQAQLRRWGGTFREQVRQEVRHHVAGQLRVVRKSFLTGFTAKVLTRRSTSARAFRGRACTRPAEPSAGRC